jgi:hypothetical protein
VSEVPPELVGAWRLVAVEYREREDEPWEEPLGEGLKGQLVCSAAGALSVQIDSPNADEGLPRYVAYFGSAAIRDLARDGDTVRGELVYSIEGGMPLEALVTDAPRPFEITGDTMVIGDRRTWQNTVERIG